MTARGTSLELAEEAASSATADIVAAFARHPTWPEHKFESRQALLAYAIASARYAVARLSQPGQRVVDSIELADESKFSASDAGELAAERLTELVGPTNALLLRAREAGVSLSKISEALSSHANEVAVEEVAERLLHLIEEYPRLSSLLNVRDEEAVAILERLVRFRSSISLSDRDVTLIAGRLAGRSYEEISAQMTGRGAGNNYGGATNVNALRQRIFRIVRRDPWAHSLLAAREGSRVSSATIRKAV